AAGLNNRQNTNRSSINSQTRSRENTQTRERTDNSRPIEERNNSSIAGPIRERSTTGSSNQRINGSRESSSSSVGDIRSRTERRTEGSRAQQGRTIDNNARPGSNSELPDRTTISRINPDSQTRALDETRVNVLGSGRRDLRVHRYDPVEPRDIVYRDRDYISRDSYHSDFLYYDRFHRYYRRTITPRFSYPVCYNRGLWFTYGYCFPYYQRKYLFVSLNGYWPYSYNYLRYYWYGYHPYYWYGYYPIARQVGTDVNYYYTYNYYGDSPTQPSNSEYYNSLAQQPAQQPAEQTLADTYFQEAVNSFEAGKYDAAVENFAKAMALAPNDMVLPFAYSQALFAAGRYSEAAAVLREAIVKAKPDQQGVFYPRGLYASEDVLLSQLDTLAAQADIYSFDPDLQLLLGYQLLGINDLDKAVVPLKKASLDIQNQEAATILLNLLAKMKTNDLESQVPAVPKREEPNKVLPQTVPVNPIPEKVEPNKALLNEQDTISINSGTIAFLDSRTQKLQPADPKSVAEQASASDQTHQKTKEGVLIAALFVLAGSTGLGHFLHH
ncbi:MAG: tetratricopeptide repeat protein, partial [Sedimentisphaerales bacterium]